MPAKNAAKYISQSIISILSQTYSEIELIIFNDNSNDNTKEIINDFKKNDNRISLIDSCESVGISFALNTAIYQAKGKYIARMDADDIANESRIEKQKNFMETNNLDVCGSQITFFNSDSFRFFSNLDLPIENELIKYSMLFINPFAHPTIFGKRDFFVNNPYISKFDGVEDFELWSRFINNSFIKFANYPFSLLNYRVHDSQFSRTFNKERSFKLSEIKTSNWEKLSLVHPSLLYFKNREINNLDEIIYSYEFILKKLDKKLIPLFQKYFSSFFNIYTCKDDYKIIYFEVLIKTVGKRLFIRRLSIDFFRLIKSIFINRTK